MSNIGPDQRAQDESDERTPLKNGERCLRIKRAASRKPHNVVQKAQRAGERAVLVVDLGIDVPAVGGSDQRGGGLVSLIGLGASFRRHRSLASRLKFGSPLERRPCIFIPVGLTAN